MKVMIATGGTGGHIYPALALAEVLKKQKPDSEIVFFGSDDRMEAQIIPEMGYKFYGLHMTGMNGGVRAKISSAASLLIAGYKCRKILREEKPDICVGFGNYISVPLIIEASRLKIPTMIHEQNSFAGKANKLLAKYCNAIACCYEINKQQMPARKIRVLGNPEAQIAAETAYDPDFLKQYGLDPEKPFVVFMMGSLGSTSVSKVIDEACALFDRDYQLLIAAGKSNEYEFRNTDQPNIRLVPYVDGKIALKCCSCAVVRAGATTMAELSAIGCASILIPSPYVPNNHQVFNAQELVKQDGAVMIEEKDLTAQKLADTLNGLMKDPQRIEQMKENARAAGKVHAADEMIAWMEELTDGSDARKA